MRGYLRIRTFWLICLMLLLNIPAFAADKGTFSTKPTTNQGKKWRIGYYEAGPYLDYQMALIATVRTLMSMNWIDPAEIPKQQDEQTGELWKWLATNTKSKFIQFVEDAHYSANWDENLRQQSAAAIIERLNQKKDLDVMIAVGSWAGQDLANDKHHTPTVVWEVGNAVALGIIKSITDSGYDHIHAMINPTAYELQIRLFHDIIRFRRLGVAYENTAVGRSDTGVDQVENLSKKLGFEIVSCYTQDNVADLTIADESVKQCFQEFVKQKVDAIYVMQQGGVNENSIPELVQIANAAQIPTFSQAGSREVRAGFLLSLAHANFKYEGRFYAETLAKILNGAKPRQLDQVFEKPLRIAINLKTAEMINYSVPVNVLGEADEIYQEIGNP